MQKRRYLSASEKLAVVKRQDGKCACGCQEKLEVGSIDFHHAVPLQFGGDNSLHNFRALIKKHHLEITKKDTKARAKADRIAKREGLMKKRLSEKDKAMQRIIDAGSFGGILLAAFLFVSPGHAQTLDVTIVRIIDGDTFVAERDGQQIRVRVSNIDTPEKGRRAACQAERKLAEQATKFARDFLGRTAQIHIDPKRPTDFYRRTLATVSVDGHDLGAALISQGLAKPWRGRQEDWC